jgi:hypothetical protein
MAKGIFTPFKSLLTAALATSVATWLDLLITDKNMFSAISATISTTPKVMLCCMGWPSARRYMKTTLS